MEVYIPVFRDGTSLVGRVRSQGAAGGLRLIFCFVDSAWREYLLQEIFAIVPAVCSRQLRYGFVFLRTVLYWTHYLVLARLGWPMDNAMDMYDRLSTQVSERCFWIRRWCTLPMESAGD